MSENLFVLVMVLMLMITWQQQFDCLENVSFHFQSGSMFLELEVVFHFEVLEMVVIIFDPVSCFDFDFDFEWIVSPPLFVLLMELDWSKYQEIHLPGIVQNLHPPFLPRLNSIPFQSVHFPIFHFSFLNLDLLGLILN